MFELENIRSDDDRHRGLGAAYLADNPDEGVRVRPSDELERAMASGQAIIVKGEGDLCGLSLTYKYDVPPTGPTYSEIGTMRVTANGFGLQAFIAKLHLVQIYLEEFAGDEVPPVFAVVTPGTPSQHNMRSNVQMTAWRPPATLEVLRQNAGVPFAAGKEVLVAERAAFATAFVDLQKLWVSGRVFHTPKNSGLINVNMGWFDPDVLALRP